MPGVPGVVEDDQHPPVGCQAAVEGGLRLRTAGELLGGIVERVQEAANGFGRVHQLL